MDEFPDVLEVQRSERDGVDLRDRPVEQELLIEPLVLTDVVTVNEIISKYDALHFIKHNTAWFKMHLLDRFDSHFVKVGDVGLLFLTDVIPTFTATLHVVFWDGKLGKDRREVLKEFLRDCFERFDLVRIHASIPEINPAMRTMMTRVGFREEGILRKAWREVDSDFDLHVFGLLRGEL